MNQIQKKELSQAELQKNSTKIFNYIAHTTFFSYMRNHYESFAQMQKSEIKSLMRSGQILRVNQRKNMLISFNQPTIGIVIYGDISIENKRYTIGKFFIVGDVKVDISFNQKTLLVMFHKGVIELQMNKFEDYYFKKKLMQKLLPADLLKLNKNQFKCIVDNCIFRSSFANQTIIKVDSKQLGLLLLLDGTFSIISKNGLKLAEIDFDYFGEEILWGEKYQYGLASQSVECRYIFINRQIMLAILNDINIRAFKGGYSKRLQIRKEMENNLNQNINYAKNYMKKINSQQNKNVSIINPQYQNPIASQIRLPNKKPLIFQNLTLSNKITSSTKFTHNRRMTTKTDIESSRLNTFESFYDDEIIQKDLQYPNFQPKIYKDQKANAKIMFKKRTKSQMNDKTIQNERFIQHNKVTDKDMQNIKNLPKTLSVLLKYYESTQRLRPRPKTVSNTNTRGGFASCSKERRMITTMKLHKQIFLRQYFELKSIEDKAFKTWR